MGGTGRNIIYLGGRFKERSAKNIPKKGDGMKN